MVFSCSQPNLSIHFTILLIFKHIYKYEMVCFFFLLHSDKIRDKYGVSVGFWIEIHGAESLLFAIYLNVLRKGFFLVRSFVFLSFYELGSLSQCVSMKCTEWKRKRHLNPIWMAVVFVVIVIVILDRFHFWYLIKRCSLNGLCAFSIWF